MKMTFEEPIVEQVKADKIKLLHNLFEKLKKCGNLSFKQSWDEDEQKYLPKRTNQYLDIIEHYFAEEIELLSQSSPKTTGEKDVD